MTPLAKPIDEPQPHVQVESGFFVSKLKALDGMTTIFAHNQRLGEAGFQLEGFSFGRNQRDFARSTGKCER
jgi:hypothetical protein